LAISTRSAVVPLDSGPTMKSRLIWRIPSTLSGQGEMWCQATVLRSPQVGEFPGSRTPYPQRSQSNLDAVRKSRSAGAEQVLTLIVDNQLEYNRKVQQP
jgi:hypothetical protein